MKIKREKPKKAKSELKIIKDIEKSLKSEVNKKIKFKRGKREQE